MAKSGTNIIVGIVQRGIKCEILFNKRVGIYVDSLKLEAQEFILKIVKDLEIEGGNDWRSLYTILFHTNPLSIIFLLSSLPCLAVYRNRRTRFVS